jgi:tetratricopeptide (TPR) repeat protein
MRAARVLVTCVIMMLATAPRLHAQEPLAVARQLYAAAEYEDALRLLEGLPLGSASREERQAAELYRALCLLALGRRADAERTIEALIAQDPLYRPTDDLSPRLRAAFGDAKKRVLPALVQQQYTEAKHAFDRKDFAGAAAGFKRVVDVLHDPDIAQSASQGPLADLRTLAVGFHDLSLKAIPPPSPPPPPDPPAPVSLPPTIYTGEEPNVVPPVALRQDLPKFPGAVRPGGLKGIIEVVIDAEGAVESAAMLVPTVPAYDKMLLTAAARWVYYPATVDGKPVKFRKRIQINVNEPPQR